MKIEIPYMSFYNRSFLHVLDWGSLYFILSVLASWYIHIYVFVFSLLFFTYYIYRRLKESYCYIVGLNFENNSIAIKYYLRSRGPRLCKYNIEDMEVCWFTSSQGEISSNRLVFYERKNVKFVQYCCGYWSVKLMKEINNLNLGEFQKIEKED